jgi:hypothetical protein
VFLAELALARARAISSSSFCVLLHHSPHFVGGAFVVFGFLSSQSSRSSLSSSAFITASRWLLKARGVSLSFPG